MVAMRRALLTLLWAAAVGLAFLLGLAYPGGSPSRGATPSPELREVREQLALHYYRTVPDRILRLRNVKAMLAALGDPHTEYLAPFAYSELKRQTSASYSGIGVTVLPEAGQLVVTAVPPGPARESGLQTGDVIVNIDGVATSRITFETALGRIIGPEGTTITLGVRRGERLLEFRVRRAAIRTSIVSSRVLAAPGHRVGYVGVRTFSAGTSQLLHQTIRKLEEARVGGFILDLRDNTGGLLDQAVAIASLFLPKGRIGSLESVHAPPRIFLVDEMAQKTTLPVVVLVNHHTASAAEIVAAALHENGRADVIGEPTYGKALVQSIEPLPGGAALKLTTARYLTPSGRDITGGGVRPDITAPDDPATQEDETLAAALSAVK
jgi:carboxyl-terminal processing protease